LTMADSPKLDGSGLVFLKVLCDGSDIDGAWKIMSVTVSRRVNQIPRARIVLQDGDISEGKFPISDDDSFKPGSEVEIQAGYEQQTETVFKGLVVRHGIRVKGDNEAQVVVDCRDKAVKMTIGRKNANYVDKKDSDIITTLIGNASGVTADVKSTDTTYKELVQYYCTDWDFMLSRADANGFLVITEDGTVSAKPPETGGAAQLTLSYGTDIISFDARMDAVSQLSKVTGTTWELSSQTAVTQDGSEPSLNSQGNISASDLAGVLGLDVYNVQTAAPLDKTGLKAWADAHMLRAGLAKIRGTMTFQGSAKAKPGVILELKDLGDRFNGDVYVSGTTHIFTPCNWVTEAEFGLDPEWFTRKPDVVAPPAAGWLPGVEGLQIGVVKQLAEDPEKEHKIQVTIPVMANQTQGVWARIAKFYGSSGFGAFFMPEIGDEVILGYVNNDPSHPVILGSLYSSKNAPPYTLEDDNNFKAVVTRCKHKLEFDEDKKIITIETPGSNKMIFSDDGKSISILDQNGNKMVMDTGGISMESPKDIKITAQGKIQMEGAMGVEVTSDMDIKMEGLNISAEAKVGMTAKGNATAELSASGNTTVKGAMVMIN
jgi:Rhs element Vgr protein